MRKVNCKGTKSRAFGVRIAEIFSKPGDAYSPYRFDSSAIADSFQNIIYFGRFFVGWRIDKIDVMVQMCE